jgi:DNA-binding PadR family transcriptional regulator
MIGYEMRPVALTDFEFMVLLAVLRVGEEAYGVPIAREIEQTAGRKVIVAAVYASLVRLQEKGLVSSTIGEPTQERGGRAKRFFKVTAKGLRSIRETQRAFTALWTGVPALKGGVA